MIDWPLRPGESDPFESCLTWPEKFRNWSLAVQDNLDNVPLDSIETALGASSAGPSGFVTVAPSDAPADWRRVADFGPDEIQAAIDQAQAYMPSLNNLPGAAIRYLPGVYRLTDEIEIKSASWFCPGGAANGAQFFWDGADGATFLTKSADPGSSSWWSLSGFRISEGTGTPDELLNLGTPYPVDSHCHLTDSSFKGGRRQIVMPVGFVNVHWDHLRFDSWWDYALYIVIPNDQFLSNMVLDQFTFDSNEIFSVTESAKAFVGIELTAAGVDPGTIRFSNAKFEVNYNFATNAGSVDDDHPNAVVHIIQDGISAQCPMIQFDNCNLTWDQGLTTHPPESWVYRDTTATGGIERVLLTLCEAQNATRKLLGGYQPGQTFGKQPVLPSYIGRTSYGLADIHDVYDGAHAKYTRAFGSSTVVERGIVTSSATPTVNYTRTLNGTVNAGPDNAAPDTQWGRVAANAFGVAADDTIRTGSGVTGSRPSASAVGAGAVWFDTTLGIPIWSNGSAWKKSDGSAA